jgi:predicted O-methyltransferase YrrM
MAAPAPDRRLLALADETVGFLRGDEGRALAAAAARAASSGLGPLLEVGAYRGRSTLYLAAGLQGARPDGGLVLYSLDHHHGSEEMQAGWPDHDRTLVDAQTARMDSLLYWRRTVDDAAVAEFVVGLIGTSAAVARNWTTPLALVFIDGGHGEEVAFADLHGWSPHVAPGGLLILHDVFADPRDGGRPPYECYREALRSGRFVEDEAAGCASLRVLLAVIPNTDEVAAPPRSASAASSTAAAE